MLLLPLIHIIIVLTDFSILLQVHHSSEEFNLTTAFRQPVFQGLFQLTHWFYLPAALFIPPSQFLVHSQFVFLFQFWIHSELVGDVGPLGLIFNTATFHQVLKVAIFIFPAEALY